MKYYLRSTAMEFLKLRGTLVFWVVLAVPVMDGVVQFLVMYTREVIPSNDISAWQYIANTMAIYWANLLYPLEIAIVTAMVNANEHNNNTWKILFSLPVSRLTIYISKFTTVLVLLLFSNVVVWVMSLAISHVLIVLKPEFMIEVTGLEFEFLWTCLKVYLASLLVISIQFWIAARFANFSVAVGIGVIGTFVGMVQAKGYYQDVFPWKLSLNTLSSLDGVPELALTVGILGGIIVAVLGCLHVTRRDVL